MPQHLNSLENEVILNEKTNYNSIHKQSEDDSSEETSSDNCQLLSIPVPTQNSRNEIGNKSKILYQNQTTSLLTKLDNYDKYLSRSLQSIEVNCFFECIIYIFGRLYNIDMMIFTIAALFIYTSFYENDYLFMLRPWWIVLVGLIVTLITKKAFGRPRPNINENVKRIFNWRNKESNCSMPSGDSLQSALFAIILAYYCEWYFSLLFIPWVMFSRVFYFCHYVMDTIVGSIWGIIIAFTMIQVLWSF